MTHFFPSFPLPTARQSIISPLHFSHLSFLSRKISPVFSFVLLLLHQKTISSFTFFIYRYIYIYILDNFFHWMFKLEFLKGERKSKKETCKSPVPSATTIPPNVSWEKLGSGKGCAATWLYVYFILSGGGGRVIGIISYYYLHRSRPGQTTTIQKHFLPPPPPTPPPPYHFPALSAVLTSSRAPSPDSQDRSPHPSPASASSPVSSPAAT